MTAEFIKSADGLDVGCGRKRMKDISKVFGLDHWKDEEKRWKPAAATSKEAWYEVVGILARKTK